MSAVERLIVPGSTVCACVCGCCTLAVLRGSALGCVIELASGAFTLHRPLTYLLLTLRLRRSRLTLHSHNQLPQLRAHSPRAVQTARRTSYLQPLWPAFQWFTVSCNTGSFETFGLFRHLVTCIVHSNVIKERACNSQGMCGLLWIPQTSNLSIIPGF